jgi:hypothetical protein
MAAEGLEALAVSLECTDRVAMEVSGGAHPCFCLTAPVGGAPESLCYRDGLGLSLVADGRQVGIPAAFLAAGDYHHHIALSTFDSAGGTPPPQGHTGLYHLALVPPDRLALAGAVRRIFERGHAVDHGGDHGATVSVYLSDPDDTEWSSTTTGRAPIGSTPTAAPSSRATASTPSAYCQSGADGVEA